MELGDAPYGSLLVGPGGAILAEAHNTVRRDDDITAHPELKLARWAARELDADTAARTTMYTSCQPCSMCGGGHRPLRHRPGRLRALHRATRRTQPAVGRLAVGGAGRPRPVRRGTRPPSMPTTGQADDIDSFKEARNFRPISVATRAPVHTWSSPDRGRPSPWSRYPTSFSWHRTDSLQRCPPDPCEVGAPGPPCFPACYHVEVDLRLTRSRRATSGGLTPAANNAAASRRTASRR
ncbi:hypothetical protein GCM10020000_78040 [Streptomyces olivoverticillatus]